MGVFLGQTNLTHQSQCNDTDFSIMKYSLKGSYNGNYTCAKIRSRREDSLITSIELNIPRVVLFVTNTVVHNLWLHQALESQQENTSVSEENPLFPVLKKKCVWDRYFL